MNYSHRIFLYGPVGLFVLLMLAIMGYWFAVSHAVSHKLDALNGHEIAPGVRFSFAQKTMGGFPFRIDSELDDLRIEIATSHGPTVWTAEHFAAHALTYGRHQFIFEAAGKQHIEWHNDAGELHHYDFLPGLLRASTILEGGEISRFDLDLVDADSPDVSAARFQIHLRKDPTIDGLDLVISADNAHIAPDLKPAFGSDVKSFSVNALVSPGTSFDGVLGGHADWRAALENWRTRHGGMLVKNLQMSWGKLGIAGKGALSVDAAHKPIGALQLHVDDWQPLLQQALQRKWIKGANNGLGAAFLAFAAGEGGSGALQTTLGFQDGLVLVGPVEADTLSPLY